MTEEKETEDGNDQSLYAVAHFQGRAHEDHFLAVLEYFQELDQSNQPDDLHYADELDHGGEFLDLWVPDLHHLIEWKRNYEVNPEPALEVPLRNLSLVRYDFVVAL